MDVAGVDRHHEENYLWVMLHRHQQDQLWHSVVYQVTCCELVT